jgi:gamma-glutamyl-gamma-aminobutyrate hydrolase PuuD
MTHHIKKPVLLLYRELDETGPYQAAIDAAGAEPVLVSAGEPFDLDAFAGVLLTGGEDVNPALYGQERHPMTEPSDDVRDAEESRVIASALALDLPLLAICRGQQILNVQHGGSLIQHVENVNLHQASPADKSQPAHHVDIVPGTLLAEIAGAARWDVNSRHHQALDRVGPGLRVTARSADGVIEAVERPGMRFMLAVQWHPEDQSPVSAEQRKLFEAFASAL